MSQPTTVPPLAVTEDGDRLTVRFPDHTCLTEANAEAVGRGLADLVRGRVRPHLCLDLGHVDFLTSSTLGVLVALGQRVRAAGGRLTLANPRPDVRKVLALTCLDRVLGVQPPPEMA